MMSPPSDDPPAEGREAKKRKAPASRVVHAAITAEGMEELSRSTSALAWSALAGGLSMGFSLIAEAALHAHLPAAPWRPLVTNLGYSVGFLIVILGRQQLFTENTLTPVLPFLERRMPVSLRDVLRLWVTVLLGNLLGAWALAMVVTRTGVLSDEIREAVSFIGRRAIAPGFGLILVRGIFAGWLIALIVWLQPAAETARIWVIVIITWLIGVGQFSHVIAGSTEVFALAAHGDLGWGRALGEFTAPALIGNILGGVGLVACLNHAQVRSGEDG